MMSRNMYDNTGAQYNVSQILAPQATLDEDAYKRYSPLFLSASFAVSYGTSFASITATLVHSLLYFRKQICLQARRSLSEQPDVHARLMARYPQVPEWWYFSILIIVFAMSAVTIEVWPTEMPIWGLVLALSVAAIYIVPTGMIQAITNQQIGLNVLTELIAGYALPGKPLALMIFKTYGYIVSHIPVQLTPTLNPDGLILGIDDGTSTAIYIRYETGSLHESSIKVNVLVPNCCHGSGRHSTIDRTTMDVCRRTRFLRAAPD
jgi:OPT family oligopeptide transporter